MISVLIPCKSEENIHKMVYETEKVLYALNVDCEILVASDGDGHGKGWAVRMALNNARGDTIVIIDGDMDIHPEMMLRLLPLLNEYDIVVGKKQYSGKAHRKIITLLSRLYIRIMFGLKVDTQTGIKMFRRYAISPWSCDSFAFDIQMLYKAHKRGFKIAEVPVIANVSKRMRLKSILNCFKESLKIKCEYK